MKKEMSGEQWDGIHKRIEKEKQKTADAEKRIDSTATHINYDDVSNGFFSHAHTQHQQRQQYHTRTHKHIWADCVGNVAFWNSGWIPITIASSPYRVTHLLCFWIYVICQYIRLCRQISAHHRLYSPCPHPLILRLSCRCYRLASTHTHTRTQSIIVEHAVWGGNHNHHHHCHIFTWNVHLMRCLSLCVCVCTLFLFWMRTHVKSICFAWTFSAASCVDVVVFFVLYLLVAVAYPLIISIDYRYYIFCCENTPIQCSRRHVKYYSAQWLSIKWCVRVHQITTIPTMSYTHSRMQHTL